MKKLNWGIIGLGNIAYIFSNAFNEIENARLIAIASKDNKKLKKFSEKFNIEKKFQFEKYQNLLNCNEVDIVYIALPNTLHLDWILEALKCNKNVLVEKPAVTNFAEANEIKNYLGSSNLFFSEAFMYRYHPQIKLILDIIRNNEIGNLLSMKSFYGKDILTKKIFYFFNKKRKIDPKSRLFNRELGGGCILDLGCYTSSFSLLIGSLISKVNTDNLKLQNVVRQIGETGVDIESSAELSFQSGFKSKIFSSFKSNLGYSSIIKGEKGKKILNNTWAGGDIILKVTNNSNKIIEQDSNINIYSCQIKEISNRILNKMNSPSFPVMSINETIKNIKVVENWINY